MNQNFQNWFWIQEPIQILSLLIKATFPFYQHLPLSYHFLRGKQPNLSLVIVSTPGKELNKFNCQRLRKIEGVGDQTIQITLQIPFSHQTETSFPTMKVQKCSVARKGTLQKRVEGKTIIMNSPQITLVLKNKTKQNTKFVTATLLSALK